MKLKANLAKGRFTGDPSYEIEHIEVKRVGEGEDAGEEEETVNSLNWITDTINFNHISKSVKVFIL